MKNIDRILKALHAFIVINRLEVQGIEYIDRLAIAAKICNDECTWILFSELFKNEKLCIAYLRHVETVQN